MNLNLIYYISDGAASQYKNYKNCANLMMHQEDFGIPAQWHFTATSHGKSRCDAVSGVVKASARRGSLKYKQYIETPEKMYEYCRGKLTSDTLKFIYVEKGDIAAAKKTLLERYKMFKQIPGSRNYHSFQPCGVVMLMRKYSSSLSFASFSFKRPEITPISFENLVTEAFYCFIVGEKMQLGMLVNTDSNEHDATFQVMKLNRRNGELTWPQHPITILVPLRDIVTVVPDPETADGIKFSLPGQGFQQMKELYQSHRKANGIAKK